MTAQTKAVIKTYFERGDRPTQAQFADLVDSYQDFSQSLADLAAATITQAGLDLLADANTADQRATLGLGTAAIKNTGTSGANIPLLDGNNSHSGTITMIGAAINEAAYANVASAVTVDLGAVASNNVNITGNTGPITSFGSGAAGITRRCFLSSNPTITYNATSLILPSSANIIGAVGDTFTASSNGSGNWIITDYQRRDGTPVGGANYKIVTATRDMTTASGNQDITGFGFTPKSIEILAVVSLQAYSSIGIYDGTTSYNVFSNGGNTTGKFATSFDVIAMQVTGSDAYSGIPTFLSDGVRIAWTRTGGPTGTISFSIKANR